VFWWLSRRQTMRWASLADAHSFRRRFRAAQHRAGYGTDGVTKDKRSAAFKNMQVEDLFLPLRAGISVGRAWLARKARSPCVCGRGARRRCSILTFRRDDTAGVLAKDRASPGRATSPCFVLYHLYARYLLFLRTASNTLHRRRMTR